MLLWLLLCEQKKKFGFDIYCNKMHMYCLKIAEKILCIANAQEILIPGFGFLPKCPTSEKVALCNTIKLFKAFLTFSPFDKLFHMYFIKMHMFQCIFSYIIFAVTN